MSQLFEFHTTFAGDRSVMPGGEVVASQSELKREPRLRQ